MAESETTKTLVFEAVAAGVSTSLAARDQRFRGERHAADWETARARALDHRSIDGRDPGLVFARVARLVCARRNRSAVGPMHQLRRRQPFEQEANIAGHIRCRRRRTIFGGAHNPVPPALRRPSVFAQKLAAGFFLASGSRSPKRRATSLEARSSPELHTKNRQVAQGKLFFERGCGWRVPPAARAACFGSHVGQRRPAANATPPDAIGRSEYSCGGIGAGYNLKH